MASGGPREDDKQRRAVTTKRRLPISRKRLFELWTNPVHLMKWWGPIGWRVVRCEVDLKPDGRWHTWLLTGRNEERSIGGRYVDVVPPERLVFTWEFPASGADGAPQVTVVKVTFLEDGDGTMLQIEHRKLSNDQAVDMDVGWNSTLDSLQRYVQELLSVQRSGGVDDV